MKRLRLYTERTKRGFTQEQIAKQIGITKQSFSRIELGHRGASAKVWDALEDLFGVDQRELRSVSDEKKSGVNPPANPAAEPKPAA